MRYPPTLSDDLKYLSAYYGWNAADKAEVRVSFTESAEMVRFYTVLAAAHRAGYEQCVANGFARLQHWCVGKGLGDPFAEGFDVAALDAVPIVQRETAA